jgi:hypothetical protein
MGLLLSDQDRDLPGETEYLENLNWA